MSRELAECRAEIRHIRIKETARQIVQDDDHVREFLGREHDGDGGAAGDSKSGCSAMTQITNDHVEWAVSDRLRRMLDGPAHEKFNVTQTYALFTTIVCWVMQHVRISANDTKTPGDGSAHRLFETLSIAAIADDPWRIKVAPVARIGSYAVKVPAPDNFESHTVGRFLINLRDATAHGDARIVSPFNVTVGPHPLLAGFSFKCAEKKERRTIWEGKIILLEEDMRRIGIQLAKAYCNALRRSECHRKNNYFGTEAASIKETAA